MPANSPAIASDPAAPRIPVDPWAVAIRRAVKWLRWLSQMIGTLTATRTTIAWATSSWTCLSNRYRASLRHPWSSLVIESRTDPTPTVIEYMDSMIGMFGAGGFSIDLTHHAVHAMGSRLLGFSQELFDDTPDDPPEIQAIMLQQMADRYPHISEMVAAITHDDASVVGLGCDDQFEFEFALDLMLNGLERLRERA
jgi:hypothetical protein